MRSGLAFLEIKEEGGSAPSARMASKTTSLMSSNSSWWAERSEIERIVQWLRTYDPVALALFSRENHLCFWNRRNL